MYFDKIDYTIFEIANKNGFTPIEHLQRIEIIEPVEIVSISVRKQ